MRKIIAIIFFALALQGFAQHGQVLEEVVAVVGDNIILKSELETEYLQAKQQTPIFEGDLKCAVLHQLIIQKLYLHKGQVDTVNIVDERVEQEVNRRIQYFAAQIGGERQLEQYLGISVDEYRAQMRPRVKDQMVIQEVQRGLMKDVKVSPTQVKDYFNAMPADSIPTFELEVEVAQIIMKAEPSELARQFALEEINKIRAEILKGTYTFAIAASIKSNDPGTAQNGGELGYFGRGKMVNAFERIAFALPKDSVSEVFETEFGYHIMQVIDKKGEKVNARHILIKPLVVATDLENTRKKISALIKSIKADSVSLCKAASEFSVDPYTKDNCGYFSDQNTGSQRVPISQLDPEVANIIRSMEKGNYTLPLKMKTYDGSQAYRVVYLQDVIPEHKASLTEDYQKIQKMALSKAQDNFVKDWVEEYKVGVYVWIDEKYVNCKELEGWKGLN